MLVRDGLARAFAHEEAYMPHEEGRTRLRRLGDRGRPGLARPCFVNYRTTDDDVLALVEIVRELGARLARGG